MDSSSPQTTSTIIHLTSGCDGTMIEITEQLAMESPVLKMLIEMGRDGGNGGGNNIKLDGFNGYFLSRMISYMMYKQSERKRLERINSALVESERLILLENFPPLEWDMDSEESLDLLLIGDYLEL